MQKTPGLTDAELLSEARQRLQECAQGAARMQGERDVVITHNQTLARLLTESLDVNKALGYLIQQSSNPGKEQALAILGAHVDECERVLASQMGMEG
ncbi:hypothetical protein ACL00X_06740 [Aeromonas diversa]|uniref:hypothetical protein n=1 Tax=Aeromonas diversa TaxID=502790 RepID=UPI0039A355C3